MKTLTQAEAKELFDYRDGALYWKIRPKHSRKSKDDMEAGSITTGGYKKFTYRQQIYYVHQVVYLIHHGYFPKLIDHIDRNTSNNKIENLRESNKMTNAYNTPLYRKSKSGCKNVIWHEQRQKWSVRLIANKKSIHIGLYKDLELADLVATMAREKYHGAFAKH